ncbi:hypothetical protein FQN54_000261 [Arachnomyces sp. PD_36]|nr:hypothetical protein FQN54_000261 [Arachnomyces sp. PD_36]
MDQLFNELLVKRQDPFDQSNDPNIGSTRDGENGSTTGDVLSSLGLGGSTSLAALLSSLLPSLLVAVIWLSIFIIFRQSHRRFYAPRTYLGCMHEQYVPPLPHHLKMDTENNVRAVSGVQSSQGALSIGFVLYTVTRESIFYSTLRQAYLFSPLHAKRISSRTVLFMSVPEPYSNETKLRQVFGEAVKRIWIITDTKEVDKLVKERDELVHRLEHAETSYIKAVNAARLKKLKKDKPSAGEESSDSVSKMADTESQPQDGSPSLAEQLGVKRPTHRLKYFTGKKVDTIDYLREQLQEIIPKVDAIQLKHRAADAKLVSAVFIEFCTQSDAQIAFQTLAHHQPLHMAPRFIGVGPSEVIWHALNFNWWERVVRRFAIQAFITVMIIFWSIPSALVGTISNISYLTDMMPFLSFINKVPIVLALVSGLLPSAALALLMALVPIILRGNTPSIYLYAEKHADLFGYVACARQTGAPSVARAELFVQNAHFCFQVVQVFLITTITSAASAATSQIIKDPLSAKDLLAKNLPKSSNFYISYFIFQGLMMSTGAVVQVAGLLLIKVFKVLVDTTPRKLYVRWTSLSGLCWGTVFPIFTNMAVIAITYSCIAPLILGFASVGLYLVYQAYRYNLLFVYDSTVDTKGRAYPRALQHVLVGIYLSEVCMIGLFAIKAAIGPVILMVLFTVFTVLAHISLNDALGPVVSYLPRTLEAEEEGLNPDQSDNGIGPSSSHGSAGGSADMLEAESKGEGKGKGSNVTYSEVTIRRRPVKKNPLFKWLHPDIYSDYLNLREKVRHDFVDLKYPEDVAENAYYPPSVSSPTPLVWIPRDPGGVSQKEVEATQEIIPITDEGAHLDEKNDVVWDEVTMKPPIWQEKIYY